MSDKLITRSKLAKLDTAPPPLPVKDETKEVGPQGKVKDRATDGRINNKFAAKEPKERRVIMPVRVKPEHLQEIVDGAEQNQVKLSVQLDVVIEAGLSKVREASSV